MLKGIGEILSSLAKIPGLLFSLKQWKSLGKVMRALWHALLRIFHCEERPPRPCPSDCCVHLPPDVYKRPDPLLYAQYYLLKMGLAVTWDNPDIDIFQVDASAPDQLGAKVSGELQASHPYRVRVRVWNGSYDAPAPHLPVHLSFLTFGIATTLTAIATAYTDLGVKGSPLHPAFAFFDWTTPGAAGHYCLQARLEWVDDANPENNLGQKNVNVGVLHSPADFTFTLRNDGHVRRRYVLEADIYALPPLPPCDDPRRTEVQRRTRIEESRARWAQAKAEQGYGSFPVSDDWNVTIDPSEVTVPQQQNRTIQVSIEPKTPAALEGKKAFNIHAFAIRDDGQRDLVGGVTFYVTKD